MAKSEATLLLRIKQAGSKVLDRVVITLGDIINIAKKAGEAFVDFAKRGDNFTSVQTAFQNLAASQGQDADKMLAKMRELSKGTIRDLDLMKRANQALLLGLPVDRFGDMLEIARSSAKATGQSMDFMLNSIVTGLGRGSRLMLDNLGIIIDTNKANEEYAAKLGKTADKLSDAERKQAFINKALEIGTANAKKAGDGQLTLGEKIQQTQATFANFVDLLSIKLAPALNLAMDAFQSLFSGLTEGNSTMDALVTVAQVVGNVFVALGGVIELVGKQIGTSLGNIATVVSALASGDFKGAFNSIKLAVEETGNNIVGTWENTLDRIQKTNEAFEPDPEAEAKKMAELEQKKAAAKLQAIQEASAEEKALREEQELLKQEEDQLKHEMDMANLNMREEEKLAAKMAYLDFQIKNELDHDKKMALIRQRAALQEQVQEQAKQEQILAMRKDTYAKIATLSNSNNKTLAAIGKAAAITQIAIDTPMAISKALAAFPPPFNFAAAGAVAAAMAAQAAAAAGVQLAEGGIVKASPGGTQATIGEGGRDEAVIPLDDEDAQSRLGGGGVSVTFTGPVMGDRQEAEEFARMIDQELFKLRKSNQSLAFDTDIG